MRNGGDVQLSSAAHTYREMLLQIAHEYPGLPDVRTLSLAEITFFYDGLRHELRTITKPKSKSRAPRR